MNSIISVDLLMHVEELLNGGRIEVIANDEEFRASTALLKIAKRTAADLESERKERVEPLNVRLKEINAEYKEKSTALAGMIENVSRVGSKYQLAMQSKADEERRKAEAAAEAERKRLAEIEAKRLAEEERLRAEAQKKAEAAQSATDSEEKYKLTEAANLAADTADIAAREAVEAARAIETVQADVTSVPRVITPNGAKAKIKYSAKVTNHRAAMEWLVRQGEWSAIENQAFKNCVESAMNKIASFQEEKFMVPGCQLVKDSSLRVKF